MRILVIGANGQVGKHIVHKLKDTEDEVVAMVRDSNQIPQFENIGVKTVLGNLEKDFSTAYYGVDAVIFAAGSGPHTGADKTLLIDQEGAIQAVNYAKRFGVDRFIMLSSMAADRPEVGPEGFRHYLYAKHRADEYVKNSGLNYTIVRPGVLTNEAGTGKVRFQDHIPEFGEIPREDVAEMLVHLFSMSESKNKDFDLVSGDQRIKEIE